METIINQQKFKRLIAISDIHSRIDLLKKMVEEVIQFNEREDCLVFLGDYTDYRAINKGVRNGINSAEVVRYVSELRNRYPEQIILLKGNHEAMAYRYFQTNDPQDLNKWEFNGGTETIESFGGSEAARKILVPFIESLSLYAESEEYIFVHGCIPYGKTLKTATEKELLSGNEFELYRGDKTLVLGHSVHKEITFYPKAIVIDTGAFCNGKLSGYDVINQKIYESVDP